jgi:hypothetical protein
MIRGSVLETAEISKLLVLIISCLEGLAMYNLNYCTEVCCSDENYQGGTKRHKV